ncbi:MAG: ORF6N domain-containing protein [Epsilonproteobacteria bacterium]|nr:ORF6N domain-containing protein [Campylobacterota bacterium]
MQVMLDEDLAILYDVVEPKRLNEQVKRNIERFPKNFGFQLTENGYEILNAIEEKGIPKKQHIFYDGQIFDAHIFVNDLIKSAKKSLILIDNYIDETVLTLLSKNQNIDITLYTKTISKQLKLDIKKYNTQYKKIVVKKFNLPHDRFLIIDEKEIYHFGTSLKDLDKKWFAFLKMDTDFFELIGQLE